MRYDLIDIQGPLKINGSVGFNGAALGFSGSNIEWIENSVGTTASLLNNGGYNYLILGATGTSIENGQALYDAYNYASANIDNPSVENRFTILLMPGEYDFGFNGIVLNNYIDIIGISSNPYDTIIRNSIGNWVFRDTVGVDMALENIYLYGDGYLNIQANGNYYRWKNIVVGGITFDTNNILQSLDGEFKDITILDGANFAYALDIGGLYENIKGGDIGYFFRAENEINIEIKNVTLSSVSNHSFYVSSGNLEGTYENIKINYAQDQIFYGSGGLYGNFKKIELGYSLSCFTSQIAIFGSFKDLNFGNISGDVFSGSTVGGDFRNIRVLSANSFFQGSINVDLFGFFADSLNNFMTGDVNSLVSDVKILSGKFSFVASVGQEIRGTFSNLNINSDSCFDTTFDDMYVSLHNSKIKGGFLNSGGALYATLWNLYLEPYSNCITSLVTSQCNIRNVIVGDVTGNILTSGGSMFLDVDNLICGNVSSSAITTTDLNGSFYNIKFGHIGNDFVYSDDHVKANFDYVQVGNVGGSAFRSNTLFRDYSFRKIKIGDCGSASFISPSFDTSPSPSFGYTASFINLFEDIEVGNVNGDFFVANSSLTGRIRAFLKNIKVGNVNGNFIRTYYNDNISPKNTIIGNFKNLKANVVSGSVFSTNSGDGTFQLQAIGTVENLTVASCSDIFHSYMWISVKIRNVNVKGAWKSIHYRSSLENSTIDQTGRSGTVSLSSQTLVMKRSTFVNGADTIPLTDPYFGGSAQVYLSAFNNTSSPPFGFTSAANNIINANISAPD